MIFSLFLFTCFVLFFYNTILYDSLREDLDKLTPVKRFFAYFSYYVAILCLSLACVFFLRKIV